VSRSPRNRIRDMQAAVQAIIEFERAGRDSAMAFDAVRMRLLEIGEAAAGIPQELRDTEPDVPWARSSGCGTGRPTAISTLLTPMSGQLSTTTSPRSQRPSTG
jgi:hypothetical protein